MRLVKRYPNRKLYDTEDKKYVTLHDIAHLIRLGHEVQVTDHGSGEDLTAITLTQIILEQEKRHAGFLPRPVLTGLIQAGGKRLSTLRRTLATPLGLYDHVDEEIDRRLRRLTRRGELDQAQDAWLREKLLAVEFEREPEPIDLWESEFERLLGHHATASRADVRRLEGQVERILQKVDSILERRASA